MVSLVLPQNEMARTISFISTFFLMLQLNLVDLWRYTNISRHFVIIYHSFYLVSVYKFCIETKKGKHDGQSYHACNIPGLIIPVIRWFFLLVRK